MIKIRIIHVLVLIFVLAVSGCDTKDNFEGVFRDYFVKYYGQDGNQQGVDLIVNEDGTMLLLGNTISPEGVSQVFLVKVDEKGTILWQKTLGGINETAVDIEPALNEGEFVILSNVFQRENISTSLNEYDTKLLIINGEGEPQDSTTKSAFWNDQVGYTVTPISSQFTSGGYMISGSRSDTKSIPTTLPPPDLKDIIVMFYNATLDDTIWTYSAVNQHIGSGIKVFESKTYDKSRETDVSYKDRPFYLFGYSDELNQNEDDLSYENNFWIVSLTKSRGASADDFNGDPAKDETMSETIEAIGSGFISIGTQTSSTGQNSVILATSQADGSGLKFTSQTVRVAESRNLSAVSIAPSIAGGRYLILSNETSSAGTTNLWLSKVDIEGNVIWSVSFGSVTKNDFAGTVWELSDGKIVILGTTGLEPQNSKMTLIKVNSEGELLN